MATAGRWPARGLLAAAYFAAGVLHLAKPGGFVAIVPTWVPYPAVVVAATGVCELFGAVGLVTTRFRWWAGVMLALYAVCVFPANIHHAVDDIAIGGSRLGWGYHGPRLLLQPVIVWWALYAGAVIDWPFRKRAARTLPDGPHCRCETGRGQTRVTAVTQPVRPVRDARQ